MNKSRVVAAAIYLGIGAGVYLASVLLAGGLGLGLHPLVEALLAVALWPIVLILALFVVSGGR